MLSPCQLQSPGGWDQVSRDQVCLERDLVKAKTKQIQEPALWLGGSSCTAAIVAELVFTETQSGFGTLAVYSEVQAATQPENTSDFSRGLNERVCLDSWVDSHYLSLEPNNIAVEGIHVSTCYRSPLLHISEMFANFEMFQTMMNDIILFP